MAGYVIWQSLILAMMELNPISSKSGEGFIDGECLLFAEIRHALRMMRRTPLITTAVVLTVMLAIGANTTIFSVVNAVLQRPLPFREPGALVQVAEKNDKLNLPTFSSSILNFVFVAGAITIVSRIGRDWV
jgi:hypothetical protein